MKSRLAEKMNASLLAEFTPHPAGAIEELYF